MNIQVDSKIIIFLILLPLFLISISVHEMAHALLAHRFGDNTAKEQGRLTLNPLKHIDLFGTVLLPIISFSTGFALIGWAKPVPVNPSKFRSPRRDDIIVSFAGPFSNFILAVIMLVAFVFLRGSGVHEIVLIALFNAIYLNLFLFIFNLIPIPPLDGSHILYDVFPNRYTAAYRNNGLIGFFLLMVLINIPSIWGSFTILVNFIVKFFIRLIPI